MGKNVLVVDDDPVVRFLLSECLALHGHKVVSFADGREGLVWLKDQSPDLIFIDMMMPGMNGIELLTAIRKDLQLTELPIIMLSANADRKIVAKSGEFEPNEYLEKPWDLPLLLEAMERLAPSPNPSTISG